MSRKFSPEMREWALRMLAESRLEHRRPTLLAARRSTIAVQSLGTVTVLGRRPSKITVTSVFPDEQCESCRGSVS